jgi:hypothetical protein
MEKTAVQQYAPGNRTDLAKAHIELDLVWSPQIYHVPQGHVL